MNVLILSCSTGQGHNSVASAIKEYYEQQGAACYLEDALGFISPGISKAICWGHVTMYRHVHGLFQIGYQYSERHSGLFRGNSAICRLLSLGVEKIHSFIETHEITQVICTHVFASLMITKLQSIYHLPIHTCLVATDYTCNPGTKESTVDLHFIPDQPLSVFYECPDIQDQQIVSSGIPVRQMFYHRVPKVQAKLSYGIPVSHSHLLMMCGSMGCGPMEKLSRNLSLVLPANSDLTIVCGTNKALKAKLEKQYRNDLNIHILGYVDDMSLLMDSADLYLTKPGGISITEAAVKNLPMVFIDAVAGCEEYNKIYFIRNRAAKTAKSTEEIAVLCASLLSHPGSLQDMQRNLRPIASQNAGAIIYDQMLALESNQKALEHIS